MHVVTPCMRVWRFRHGLIQLPRALHFGAGKRMRRGKAAREGGRGSRGPGGVATAGMAAKGHRPAHGCSTLPYLCID